MTQVYAVLEYAGDKEDILVSRLTEQGGTPGAWVKGSSPPEAAGSGTAAPSAVSSAIPTGVR